MPETLEKVYNDYVAFGSTPTAKKSGLTSANFMKLMKDSKLIAGKLTRTDIDLIFTKAKAQGGKTLSFEQFKTALKMAAKVKYGDDNDENVAKLHKALTEGKGPSTAGATKASKDSATSRLTDSSKYTGSHKERFDEEGKGKGIEGRKDLPDKSGYVTGYKEKDTYDKKH